MKYVFLENQNFISKKQKLLRCEIDFTMVTLWALLTVSLNCDTFKATQTLTHTRLAGTAYIHKSCLLLKNKTKKQTSNLHLQMRMWQILK